MQEAVAFTNSLCEIGQKINQNNIRKAKFNHLKNSVTNT